VKPHRTLHDTATRHGLAQHRTKNPAGLITLTCQCRASTAARRGSIVTATIVPYSDNAGLNAGREDRPSATTPVTVEPTGAGSGGVGNGGDGKL
jgi:hypothetical protein